MTYKSLSFSKDLSYFQISNFQSKCSEYGCSVPRWNWRKRPKTEDGGGELGMTCTLLGERGFKSK